MIWTKKNAPSRTQKKGKKNNQEVAGELDWAYKISNEELYEITKSKPISKFCEIQYLKYIGHIVRMSNDSLQKQALFDKRTAAQTWAKIEKMLSLDRRQIWRTMMNRKDFMSLLDKLYQPSKHSHPKLNKSTRRKHWWWWCL